MLQWAQDLQEKLERAHSTQDVFEVVRTAARELGFEWCAFGLRRMRSPVRPTYELVNDYPEAWQRRYAEANYLASDPTVKQGMCSPLPMVWGDALFAGNPALWDEARSVGLRVGWAQSCFDGTGVGSLLSLARSNAPLGKAELASKAPCLNWLVSMAHAAFSRVSTVSGCAGAKNVLTRREIDVLTWSAAGKTIEDIASILTISEGTVKFHTRNAVLKLGVSNRVAAVVQAMNLRLLNDL